MAGSRSKRPVSKRRNNAPLEQNGIGEGQIIDGQPFEGQPVPSRKPFRLSCPVLFLLTAVILLLFWSGFYRDLFYMAARYDFPAEIGGEESFWADLAQPGGVRISAGSWLAAFGTLPFAVPVFLTLISLGTLFFFERLLLIGREETADSARWCFLYAFAPVLLLTVLVPVQGYYLFGCYRIGFFFSLFIGIFAAAGTAWGTAQIKSDRKRHWAEGIALFMGYPLFGSFALLAGLLMIRTELRINSAASPQKTLGQILRPVFCLLAVMAAVPLIWYPLFSSRISLPTIYSEGIFHLTAVRRDAATIHLTWGLTAGVLLLLIAPVLVSCWGMAGKFYFAKKSRKQKGTLSAVHTSDYGGTSRLTVLILVLCACMLTAYAVRDSQFRSTLSLVRLLDEQRWEEILDRESAIEEPTPPMIELRRLALIQTGRAGDEFFRRPSAGKVTESLRKVTAYRIFGPELLFYSGNVSLAEHLSMNDFVDLRDRAPFYQKWFFLMAMAKREYPLARRYFDHWERTVRWWSTPAQKRDVRMWGDFLTRTEHDGVEPADEAASSLLAGVRVQMPKDEMTHYLGLSHTIALSAWQMPFAELPVSWMEVRLLRFLTACDMAQFAETFPIYAEQLKKEGRKIPEVFQQGWIYAEFCRTHNFSPTRFACDAENVQQLANFLQMWGRVPPKQPDGHFPAGSEPILDQLKQRFAGTWWYYAHREMDAEGC